jgi:hypothetical protein
MLLLLITELYNPFIGKIINDVYPCHQEQRNSAPCYLRYDVISVLFIAISTLAGIIFTLLISFKKKNRKDKNQNDSIIDL